MRCAEPKRTELFDYLGEIRYNNIVVEDNAEIASIATEIQARGILPSKSANDRMHIAAAIYGGCHIIVSWNFKHLVNIKTIEEVRIIALLNGLPPVDIYAPPVLLERRDLDG